MSAADGIAIGAAVVAALALVFGLVAWWNVRAVRKAQLVLLGGGKQDLVDFAVSLQARIDDVLRAVDEVAAGLSRVDRRVDASIQTTSIVRYDAIADAGGHQSASVAMLDSLRTCVVVAAT